MVLRVIDLHCLWIPYHRSAIGGLKMRKSWGTGSWTTGSWITGSWTTERTLETVLKYISIIEVTGLAYIAPVMGSREQANKENSHNLHM